MRSATLFQTARQVLTRAIAAPSTDDERQVTLIQEAAARLRPQPSEKLRTSTAQLQAQAREVNGEFDAFVIPAFALMVEAIRRTLGMELFDVQLLAGLVLARGAVAEMQTGEGKTLAQALPALVHSLAGRGVHMVTTNSYLAERDWQQLKPAYDLLGISAGLLPEGAANETKRGAYACDITFGTGYEFGFDYLRDALARLNRRPLPLGRNVRQTLQGRPESHLPLLQRGHHLAIVDEIDSVLIDEACLPLVLNEIAQNSAECSATASLAYRTAQDVVESLCERNDFYIERESDQVMLTERGFTRIQESGSYRSEGTLFRPWVVYIENALRANYLLRRDVDYVQQDRRVLIVDEFTGRVFADRSWSDGLHQAVEAKERLPIRAEMTPAGRVSRQRYFRRYQHLCGTTGTVAPSDKEFWRMYRLPVTAVPLRTPSRRICLPTRFFSNLDAKWRAIVREIVEMQRSGRPVLVGSRTIENSQLVAARLQAVQVPFRLLNGHQDQVEAEVIAKAGAKGAVTIATNMAGRGTDIRLATDVAQLGGLHLIGVERHESRRIDRQLVGRVARQGDPGSCQFFVSAEDPLLLQHGSHLRRRMRHSIEQGGEFCSDFSAELARVQRRAESVAYRERRDVLTQDSWLDEILATLGDAE